MFDLQVKENRWNWGGALSIYLKLKYINILLYYSFIVYALYQLFTKKNCMCSTESFKDFLNYVLLN